jgi:enterochelin esterase-like enzyme
VVSPAFVAGLGVLAAASWVGRRRVRHRAARVVALAATVLLTVGCLAGGVNAYFGYLPRLADVANAVDGQRDWPVVDEGEADEAPGRVFRLAVTDSGTGIGDGYALVWLPPQYATEPARRFPVLYLFHGSPGVPADWFRGGQADRAAADLATAGRPVIVVAPRMSRGWLDDPECVDGVSEQVRTHFVRDVVPTVDRRLRTVASREGRAVGGMSAGGYCALNLGLHERALVSGILDLSGEVAPSHSGGISAVYGTHPERAAADSPSRYAAGLPAEPATRIWFDCGASDTALLPGIRLVATALNGRGLDVRLTVRPGGHTFRVWRPALREGMAWLYGAAPLQSGSAS